MLRHKVLGHRRGTSAESLDDLRQTISGMLENAAQEYIWLRDRRLDRDCPEEAADRLTESTLAIVGDTEDQLELRAPREDAAARLDQLNHRVEVLVLQQDVRQIEI